MDVVVDVLASNNGRHGAGGLALDAFRGVSELTLLGGQAALHILFVAMLERAVLDGDDIVVVLLTEDLGVLDRLDRGVVVVLVDLLVDGSLKGSSAGECGRKR